MVWHPTKQAVRQLWGRRWVRRISYTLVAGATLVTVGSWTLERPFVARWVVTKADALIRDETGLSLGIGHIEVHPWLGTMTLYDVSLGVDLLTIQRVELHADFASLLSTRPRIYTLRLVHPHARLTEANLARLKLKEHPPRKGPLPQVTLDLLSITGGEVDVPQALRGAPAARLQFDMKGTGVGPNRWRVDFTAPQLQVKGPAGWEKGRLDFQGEISEPVLLLHEGYLRLGESQLRVHGRFDPKTAMKPQNIEAQLSGIVESGQALRWAGTGPKAPLSGDLELKATLKGSFAHPKWTFAMDGEDLRPANTSFQPGVLTLRAAGTQDQAAVENLQWVSPQGAVHVQGTWAAHQKLHLNFDAKDLALETLGRSLHATELQGVHASAEGQAEGPSEPGGMGRLDRWGGDLKVALTQHGRDAGGLHASLAEGRAAVEHLVLDLDELKVRGSGTARLGPKGLLGFQADGSVEVDAAQVARALAGWKVVNLDMGGRTQATAQVRWSPGQGLELDGSGDVQTPRWHGAHADRLKADVDIRGSVLRVRSIDMEKGPGLGGGDIWLTWADLPAGRDQVDMCFTAFRLPIAEGLKAADIGDLPLTGTAGGWARLHGPFNHLLMEGHAQVESGVAYGVAVPAAASDFDLDIDTLRLRLEDLRAAERLDLLGGPDAPPEGSLAIKGRADMDLAKWTWWVDLSGRVDSSLLDLPGPRIQSLFDARLQGPITSPFGGLDVPEGRVSYSRGRVFFQGRSLEGLEGSLTLERGRLAGRLGLEGMERPLLDVTARQQGLDLVGALNLRIAPDSARTALVARSLTEDLMEDLKVELEAKGRWSHAQGLVWTGRMTELQGTFNAFELHQSRPSELNGDGRGAHLDVLLQGGARSQEAVAGISAAGVQLTGTLPFSATGPLGVRAKGVADLSHLKSILDRVMEVDEYSLISELQVHGVSRFDLLAHGTYLEPLLDGTLTLERGQVRLRGYQGGEDLNAQFLLKDRTISISPENPLQGTLAHGRLQATGQVTWQPGGLERYALQATLDDFQLRDIPDGLDLQGTLTATLEGNEEGGLLQGRLRADHLGYQTEVKLTDLILRSALSDSGGLVGLDPDDPLERIKLDLELDLRSPWSFDTNLLKLEGKPDGGFAVRGSLAHPVPKGRMVFQAGGRLTNIFPAGDMVVDRGSLDFTEAHPNDPLIFLQGSVTSIPGYTVNLDIHGTLSNLSIVPSSTPSLRQDEIVAILINPGNVANVGTGASSGAQGAITSGLASAGSGLISTLAFAPFQEQLRRSLGLDRVNVAVRTTSLGTTETDVTLGKSISLFGQRSAFVASHKRSTDLTITSGQVEWRFGGFTLQLGVSQSGQSGLNPSGEIRHSWSPK